MTSWLEVSGVDVFYGRIQALHGLSFGVEAGEIVSLLGNNALWMAFTLFMLLRGIIQYAMSRRMQAVYGKVKE